MLKFWQKKYKIVSSLRTTLLFVQENSFVPGSLAPYTKNILIFYRLLLHFIQYHIRCLPNAISYKYLPKSLKNPENVLELLETI